MSLLLFEAPKMPLVSGCSLSFPVLCSSYTLSSRLDRLNYLSLMLESYCHFPQRVLMKTLTFTKILRELQVNTRMYICHLYSAGRILPYLFLSIQLSIFLLMGCISNPYTSIHFSRNASAWYQSSPRVQDLFAVFLE